jgi:hypothetical protein
MSNRICNYNKDINEKSCFYGGRLEGLGGWLVDPSIVSSRSASAFLSNFQLSIEYERSSRHAIKWASSIDMADADDYECRLLADLLPTCLAVADFFAGSSDSIAVEARAGTDAFTFHQNLYYEFCRLQAGQIVTYDGSLTVLGVGVTPLLEMLESRTPRVSHFLPQKSWSIRNIFLQSFQEVSQVDVLHMSHFNCAEKCTAFLTLPNDSVYAESDARISHLYGRHGYVKALSKDWRLCDPKLGGKSWVSEYYANGSVSALLRQRAANTLSNASQTATLSPRFPWSPCEAMKAGSLIQERQVHPWLEYPDLPLALISSSAKTGRVHVFPLARISQPGFFSPYIGAIRSRGPCGSSCYSPLLMRAVHGKKPKSMLSQILPHLGRLMPHSMKRRMADRVSIGPTYRATKSGFQSRN